MTEAPKPQADQPLKEAMRAARIEAAERTGVVVDMRDADVARLELLNDELDPLFKEIPEGVDLFDRGISRGETPRLWLDVVSHVVMGRDKRMYRFVQDTRYGRTVLAESYDIPVLVKAITNYVARRLVERDRALAEGPGQSEKEAVAPVQMPRRRGRGFVSFLLGIAFGVAALFVLAYINTHR